MNTAVVTTMAYHQNHDAGAPIPVDSEHKSYPEVVPGSTPQSQPPMPHQHMASPNSYYQQPYPNSAGPGGGWDSQAATPKLPEKAGEGSPICGMRRGRFWILLTALISIVIIVVLAGILGGVAAGSIPTSAR